MIVSFRRATGAVAALTVAALAFAGCASGGGSEDSAAADDVLTIGQVALPASFDPAQANADQSIIYYQSVYDTLILREPDGTLSPMLATDWSYDETNTVLTMNLRDDVTFSDGVAFDAEAAKANLDHFMASSGPLGSYLDAVTSVEVMDDYTIQLTLDSPNPALTIYLSNAPGFMASPDALDSEDLATVPVGSGPYTMDTSATTTGSTYTFVKNEDYWNPSLQHYDEIVIDYMTDSTARLNALSSGEIDVSALEAKAASQADAAGLTLNEQAVDWRGLVIADRAGESVPALADARVRQAINLALDGESMLDAVDLGFGELTSQIFGPSSTAFVADLDSAYGYDVDAAKDLLAEAGYPDGFSMEFPTFDALDPSLWPVIEQQLEAIGIDVTLVSVPSADYFGEIAAKRFPVYYIVLSEPSTWVTYQQAIAPSAQFNPFGTTSDEINALATDLQLASSEEEEVAAAQTMNEYVVDEAWFAPLYRTSFLLYSNDTVDVALQAEQPFPSIYNFSPAE